MFFIKKSSLFFFKAILLKHFFYNKNILVFYDFLDYILEDFYSFKSLIFFFNLDFIFLSSNFINFFFKSTFFFFLKPGSLLLYLNSFEDFFKFDLKIKELSSIFLIGFCFKFFFVNFEYIYRFNVFMKYNKFIYLLLYFFRHLYIVGFIWWPFNFLKNVFFLCPNFPI